MIIDCISDLHGFEPELTGGDVLILAGDYTAADKLTEWGQFFHWLKKQPYDRKILIAGNHDNLFKSGFPQNQKEADDLKEVIDFLDTGVDFEYLCDSGTELVTNGNRLKVWGSPWTKRFDGMNPKCMAFTVDTEEQLADKWDEIPCDVDILITHSPPRGVLDKVHNMFTGKVELCGSMRLFQQVEHWKPRLHVFGHIHEGYGKEIIPWHKNGETIFVNASYVNERYKPVNSPVRVVLPINRHMCTDTVCNSAV